MLSMKTKLSITVLLVVATLVLSGCSSPGSAPENRDDAANENEQRDMGYVQSRLQTFDRAKDDIDSAVEKENGNIDDAMGEAGIPVFDPADRTYVSRYSGVVLKTNLGDIAIRFYGDDSPMTVNNFLKLADAGFYDGTKFHRVIPGFMIQGGDPNSKDDDWSDDGMGGPGYRFQDEINARQLAKGSLAMANSGPNTNGSQFFIVTAEATPWLDGRHTNFGEVVSGMDVVEKIEAAERNANDHPLEDIVVKSVIVQK